jgi:hemerythrin-like metal-binding protein
MIYPVWITFRELRVPLFNWKDEYTVKVAELDDHHKKLMNIINRIYENCLKTDMTDCVGPMISELIDYSEYHFTAEENHMQRIDYSDRDGHVEQHAMFIFKIRELQQAYDDNELELTQSLIVFLGKWLLHHVLKEDIKYADYPKNNQ